MGSLNKQRTGVVTYRCPDLRCRWTITTTENRAAEAVNKHLEADARHTEGTWIDMEGRERVGFNYTSHEGENLEQ
jgi:hypothetical protein